MFSTIAAKFGASLVAPFMVFGAHAQAPVDQPRMQNPDPAPVCTELEYNLYWGLKDRNTGGEVSELQRFLKNEGYLKAGISGNFNLPTYRAVRSFQAEQDLRATGVVNAETRAAIEAESCGDADEDEALSILGISAPSALAVGEEGTWTVDVESEGEGNLRYGVTWGDEGNARMALMSEEDAVQSSATFTHVYAEAGVYTPTFTVTDAAGNTVTKAAVTVTVSEDLAVEIDSLSKTSGYAGDEITLSGSGFAADSKVYVGGTLAEDVTIASDSSLSFTIPQVAKGSYDVYVENDNGTSNTLRFEVLVRADVRLSIESIDAPVRLAANEEGTWTVNANTNATGNLKYSVSWGDEGMMRALFGAAETVQTSSTFTHAYAEAGVYKPTFTITDETGKRASVSATVVVR